MGYITLRFAKKEMRKMVEYYEALRRETIH